MKRSIYAVLVVLFISGLSACTSYDYYVAGLNRTNLSRYRTFAWMPPGRSNNNATSNMAADAKIKDAATAALQSKGLTLNQRDPDLIVSYSTAVGKGTRTYYYPEYYGGGFYPGFGFGFGYGGWGGWGGWYRPYYYAYGAPFIYGGVGVSQESYKEGTLIIDLIDRRTRQIVWRGFGVGEVHRNPQKNIDDIPEVVAGVLDQLSLAPSSAAPAGGRGEGRGPRGRRGYITPASSRSI
ncbi:DUF4136 domain-containing protein [Mucilaginibacter sp. UR6-11]|uniref:DUF4136 domain-containing protein n=1 Tax=Mucilaginibacter sp. UR6-11 TaxID=1435644 RepID=UPI001E2F6415|nr:DUF4136 domain-containing protein [Mucilaginibacter sp. UR6-11]MCC8425097.1 DUF4136 domain-containing protein [Mucilaginibacter sp. UR6-11]